MSGHFVGLAQRVYATGLHTQSLHWLRLYRNIFKQLPTAPSIISCKGSSTYFASNTEGTLREKCPNTEFSWVKFPVFSLNKGKYGPEKTPYLDTFKAVGFKQVRYCSLH